MIAASVVLSGQFYCDTYFYLYTLTALGLGLATFMPRSIQYSAVHGTRNVDVALP